MKKLVYMAIVCSIALLTLTACNQSNKDKLQGTWTADNEYAMMGLGHKIEFKGDKVNISGNEEATFTVTDYAFKDENEDYIYFADNPDSEEDIKDYPSVEGSLEFIDDNHIKIITTDDGTYEYKKK